MICGNSKETSKIPKHNKLKTDGTKLNQNNIEVIENQSTPRKMQRSKAL